MLVSGYGLTGTEFLQDLVKIGLQYSKISGRMLYAGHVNVESSRLGQERGLPSQHNNQLGG